MGKNQIQKIGALTAMALVVANMIGTGVFTSLGFQLEVLNNQTAIIILWVLGGILALSGAFSYAELGTHIKKSGGEYSFLSELFTPFVGYMAGWVSLTVGFVAPIALSAIAAVEYFPFFNLNPVVSSIALVAVITLIHSFSLRSSAYFQNISTSIKILIIIVLIVIGLLQVPDTFEIPTQNPMTAELFSSAFAIALIYVSYSYSGWNAAVYITEEIKSPKKALPLALIGGTCLVTLLYTLLQVVFLKHVPVSEMVGQLNIGAIAAQKMLGGFASKWFGLAISILLISGLSAMIWLGPRVVSTMAKHFKLWSLLKARPNAIPIKALWFQFFLSAVLLVTGTFDQILVYCGFLLTLSALVTVAGLFKLRKTKPGSKSFKSPVFPVFQIIFITFSLYMILFIFTEKPQEATWGLANLVIGVLIWLFDKQLNLNKPNS